MVCVALFVDHGFVRRHERLTTSFTAPIPFVVLQYLNESLFRIRFSGVNAATETDAYYGKVDSVILVFQLGSWIETIYVGETVEIKHI